METSAWDAFVSPGRWYRGNLHCHSTESDGARSVADVVAFYQGRGYDFLALSDHRKVTDLAAFATERFLPLPAMEIDGHDPLVNGPYHMLVVGLHALRRQDPEWTLADLLAEIDRDGALSIFAHPYWLGSCATDLLEMPHCVGLEVYNANCEVEVGKGFSVQCWDDALQRGRHFWGFATDDAHWRDEDYGLGWLMVKAPSLEQSALMEALRRGHFYSSSGPRIEHLALHEGVVEVRCSPVDAIHFLGQQGRGRRVAAQPGQHVTAATYTLDGREGYLRVECVQREGPRAWSNPIWLA